GTWMLACNYMAVKTVYQLSWDRAFWATVLARIVLTILSVPVICVVGAVSGSLMSLLMVLEGGL
ncbi:MAG: hypothetical protein JSV36_04410, partial [Anaerolineae bacterium]